METTMKKLIVILFVIFVSVSFVFAAGPRDTSSEPELKSIVEIAVEDGRFETLVAALEAAELVDTLSGERPYTVFAPTDDAFAKLPEGTVEALLDDVPALREILLYHVTPGKVMSSEVVNLSTADTAAGKPVSISVEDESVMINDAKVVIVDIEASNGVIHVIDSVIIPPAEVASIVDITVEDGRFTTLVTALEAADLVDTLAGEGPFTVFAPTDDAFAKLPEGTVESLLGDVPTLRSILLYHVVPGSVMAEEVVYLDSVDTASGEKVTITSGNDGVMINDAKVIITDIVASNGVIHVIDRVILPPSA